MYAKCFFILLFLSHLGQNSFAQQKSIDSLQQLLLQEKTDTGKVALFQALSRKFSQRHHSDSALLYSYQALDLARKMQDIQREIKALGQIATLLRGTGNYAKALQVSLQSQHLAEQAKDTLEMFWTLRGIGWVYLDMKDYRMALTYGRKIRSLVHSGFFKEAEEIKYYSLRTCLKMKYRGV